MKGPALNTDLNVEPSGNPTPAARTSLVDGMDQRLEKFFSGQSIEEPDPTPAPKSDPTPDPVVTPDPDEGEDDGIDPDVYTDPLDALDKVGKEPVAKKTEPKPKPDDEEAPDEIKAQGDKAEAKWKDLRKAAKERDALAAELAELKTAKETATPDVLNQELETLRKQVAEYDKELSVTRVESTREYRTQVTEKLASLEDRARKLMKDPDAGDAVIEALIISDPHERAERLSDIASELPSMLQSDLYDVARQVDATLTLRDTLRANAQDALKMIEQERLANETKSAEQRRQALSSVSKDVWAKLEEKVPGLKDPAGKLKPEFSKLRDTIAGEDLRSAKDSSLVYAAAAAHLLPKVLSDLSARDAKITELEQALARYTKSSPGSGGTPSGGSGTNGSGSGQLKGESIIDRLDDAFARGIVTFNR